MLRLALVVGLSGVIATSAIAQSDAGAPAASNGPSTAAPAATDPDNDPNKVICKNIKPPTGTRVGSSRNRQRICQSRADWEQQAREDHSLDSGEPVMFLEVDQGDASVFSSDLRVEGVRLGRHRILRCTSPAIPNAIAALLLYLRDRTGRMPDAYFGWTEGNPITYLLRYLALGEGDTAPLTREVLRRAIDNPLERPRIHVG